MSDLENKIKELYNHNISEREVMNSKDNLLSFFKILYKINARLQPEEMKDKNEVESSYDCDNKG